MRAALLDEALGLPPSALPPALAAHVATPPAVNAWIIPEVHFNAWTAGVFDEHFAKSGGAPAYEQ